MRRFSDEEAFGSVHRELSLSALRSNATQLRVRLPRGGLLPPETWRSRHRGIVALLWLHVVGFSAYTLADPSNLSLHNASEVGVIAILAALASWPRLDRASRTLVCSAGMVASSGLLVHLSNGVIEMHFHFFVAVAVIALYEDWLPFLVGLGYVVLDHGIMGTLAPTLVYNHADAWAEPWKWALLHSGFVLAASAASVVHWHLNEVERIRASREHAANEGAQAELMYRKQVEAQLQEQASMLEEQAHLLDLAQDAIFVWQLNSGVITFWNRGAEELYGWPKEEVIGRTPAEILKTEFPQPLSELHADLERTGRWEGELIHCCRNGSKVVVNSRWALRARQEGQPLSAMAINSDVTERKRAQQALEYQALHDALTGLPNRLMLGSRLERALEAAQRAGIPAALLMIDLDRFKEINDTLGHEWGDRLLREVGPRLSSQMRETDTLARLGGDEFAVLLPTASSSSAERVARKLLDCLDAPFHLGGSNITVGASIGIALFPDHGADAETLLRCADVAMYVAKRAGTGFCTYVAAADEHSRDRLAVASDLRRATETDELVLHYQPKLDCVTGQLSGVEALVRWMHPQRGLLSPDQFIPLAEQTGIIGLLGRRVLHLALTQSREWRAAGLNVPVAVNLSMREILDPELPETIERLLVACDVEPGSLRVEITESSLMIDTTRARTTLQRLCNLGVKLSVDDFGTGYSSLRYLQQLPLDELKIDRSFVRHMISRDSDLTIVRSTIDLAHGLGLQVVAEGVEDADTWHRLAAVACDQAQGYYLSRPLPSAEMTEWMWRSTSRIDKLQAA